MSLPGAHHHGGAGRGGATGYASAQHQQQRGPQMHHIHPYGAPLGGPGQRQPAPLQQLRMQPLQAQPGPPHPQQAQQQHRTIPALHPSISDLSGPDAMHDNPQLDFHAPVSFFEDPLGGNALVPQPDGVGAAAGATGGAPDPRHGGGGGTPPHHPHHAAAAAAAAAAVAAGHHPGAAQGHAHGAHAHHQSPLVGGPPAQLQHAPHSAPTGATEFGHPNVIPPLKLAPRVKRSSKARVAQLTLTEKKARHNQHTRSSRLRIDNGLDRLKGTLKKVRPNLKLNKKADIVDEAVKLICETHNLPVPATEEDEAPPGGLGQQDGGEHGGSSLSV